MPREGSIPRKRPAMTILTEHQVVGLTPPVVPRVHPFAATVVALDQRVVSLAALNRAEILWLPPRVDDVMLLIHHEARAIAFSGTLRYDADSEHLRFRVEDRSFRAPWGSSRLRLHAPVVLETAADVAGPPGTWTSLTYDLGPDGIVLEGEDASEARGEVDVELTLPGEDRPVRARGVVRAVRTAGRVAVDFVAIAPVERARLRGYVSKHLRDHMKLTQAADDLDDLF